ncbi:MAG: hypothetical protein HKO53_10965 [Gemmatimonadetes bacterium]|nr:hypothetical protein [Gemmatimonadota bacterium]
MPERSIGISNTVETPLPTRAGEARTFPCEACGADLVFHVGEQALGCGYCGWTKPLEFSDDAAVEEQDLEVRLAQLRERRQEDRPRSTLREVQCEACGARVSFAGSLTSQDCPYCGMPLQVEGAHHEPDRIPVDGVLPFQIERGEARANLTRWVQSRWFAPNEFKRRGADGRFTGVYLPYWTFDSVTTNRYSGERGDRYTTTIGSGKNRRTVTRVRWSPASGAFQLSFDDVLIVGGDGLPLERLRGLEPWALEKTVPFREEFLAGFLARTYDVELPEGFQRGKARMEDAIEQAVRRHIGGDTQRVHHIDSRFDALTYKHVLLPVWMLSYRYRGEVYQVVVNATTGEVQGDRPYSPWKIALAVLGGIVGLLLLIWLVR